MQISLQELGTALKKFDEHQDPYNDDFPSEIEHDETDEAIGTVEPYSLSSTARNYYQNVKR